MAKTQTQRVEAPQRCPEHLNGDPSPTCYLPKGHEGQHVARVQYGELSWYSAKGHGESVVKEKTNATTATHERADNRNPNDRRTDPAGDGFVQKVAAASQPAPSPTCAMCGSNMTKEELGWYCNSCQPRRYAPEAQPAPAATPIEMLRKRAEDFRHSTMIKHQFSGETVAYELERLAASPSLPDRFQFVQDDSCHWYAIPAGKRDEFGRWVDASQEEYEAWTGTDFSEYRLDYGHPSNYTFTDLKRDK